MPGIDDNVLFSAHLDSGFFDEMGRHTFTTSANASIDASIKKFGAGSAKCVSGDTNAIRVSGNISDFAFASAGTVDFWHYCTSAASSLFIGALKNDIWNIHITSGGKLGLGLYGTADYNSDSSVPTSQWNHVAAELYSGRAYLYLNGVSVLDVACAATMTWHDGTYFHAGTESGTTGYFDEFRVSNVSRYSGTNFTPQNSPYTSDLIVALARKRIFTERGFHPGLIGGRFVNLNRTYFHRPAIYAIEVTEDVDDLNIRDEADSLGYAGESEAIVTVTIAEGVTVGATDDETPALDTGEFPEGFPRISIVSSGTIEGYDSGGTAFLAQADCSMTNNGTIRATGGYSIDGLTFIEWLKVGSIYGDANGDFIPLHTLPWRLRRLSRELFPQEILRGRAKFRRATHAPDSFLYELTFRQSYRVADDSLERWEMYLDGESSPSVTSEELPFSVPLAPPISGEQTFSAVVRKRNKFNIVSKNQYPTLFTIDDTGAEVLGVLSAPSEVTLYPGILGGVRVLATYTGMDRNPPTHWKVFAKEGSDPVPGTDAPVLTEAVASGLGAGFSFQSSFSGFTPGATLHVIVAVYREDDDAYAAAAVEEFELSDTPTIDGAESEVFLGSAAEII